MPLAVRRGVPTGPGATSAWTSTSSGRLPSSVGATTLPGRARAVVLARGTPAPDRRPREAAARPSRRRRPRRSSRSGSSTRGGGAARAYRSPSRASTASTRCSSVFGPAIEPSFVTWPTSTTAIAVALRELHQAERRLADLADAAGRPVELVDGRGLDRVDDERAPGRSVRASSTIRPTSLSAATRIASRPGPRAARAGRRAAGPGPPTPRRSRTARARRRRARDAGGGLEQERRLADPRLAADEHERPGDEPAAEDAVELADPDRGGAAPPAAGDGRERRSAGRGQRRRGAGRRRSRAARGRPSRRGCSTRRRRGTGPPSGGRPRRRTGRRSGSGACAAARVTPVAGAAAGDQPASTGVFGSAAWMSRPASGSLSTTIVVPGSYLPSRRCSARTSSIMFWITRRSGRAP